MAKRRDVLKAIRTYAREQGLEMRIQEGANHTRVWVGDRYTTLPRHSEIPDRFATVILAQIGVEK
ncbi:toxin HicA [Corynebacterium hylobatis]|uniref:Toxin HicA n=1 Tax=Corynebacterium hylobatis TaxID=1859290 RepID=A0A430I1L7_9CORY|nr:toxin HicA [Corynebacterium hylobatis]RSZ65521.1 toxin HicA [Corynebacterium hylobatis]